MKQYMANGNFTRSTSSVTANASLAFVGNIDDSVDVIINSPDHDLFKPLHPVFDLAIIDRFHTFVPGWEIPKNKDENLTRRYGLIIEYLAKRSTTSLERLPGSLMRNPRASSARATTSAIRRGVKTVCAF